MIDENIRDCKCIEELIRSAKKGKISFQGLAIAYQPDGSNVQGLMTIRPPIIYGGHKRIAIMGFTFCPFCGKQLHEIAAKQKEETP